MLVEVSKENKKFDFDYKAQDLEGFLRRRPERSEEVLEGVFKSCYPDQRRTVILIQSYGSFSMFKKP